MTWPSIFRFNRESPGARPAPGRFGKSRVSCLVDDHCVTVAGIVSGIGRSLRRRTMTGDGCRSFLACSRSLRIASPLPAATSSPRCERRLHRSMSPTAALMLTLVRSALERRPCQLPVLRRQSCHCTYLLQYCPPGSKRQRTQTVAINVGRGWLSVSTKRSVLYGHTYEVTEWHCHERARDLDPGRVGVSVVRPRTVGLVHRGRRIGGAAYAVAEAVE